MTKLELIAKVLLSDLDKPEQTPAQKADLVESALKSYAADLLNQLTVFKEKALAPEVVKELLDQVGIKYDLRTLKFS